MGKEVGQRYDRLWELLDHRAWLAYWAMDLGCPGEFVSIVEGEGKSVFTMPVLEVW